MMANEMRDRAKERREAELAAEVKQLRNEGTKAAAEIERLRRELDQKKMDIPKARTYTVGARYGSSISGGKDSAAPAEVAGELEKEPWV